MRKMRHVSKEWLIVIFLFVFALVIRFYPIPHELFFGPEQGRDALAAYEIYHNHNFTLIGAKTDIDGIFHGPVFYYFLAIAYLVTNGDPIWAAFITIVVNTTPVILLFWVSRKFFSPRIGILAAFLYAISLRATDYSRWFSAPPLVLPLIVIFLFSLYQVLQKKYIFFLLAAFVFGIIVQLQILNFYLFLPLMVVFFGWGRVKVPLKEFIIGIALWVATLSTFIIFDVRHDFLMTKTLVAVATSENRGFRTPIVTSIRETWERFTSDMTSTIAPHISWLAPSIFLIGFYEVLKHVTREKFSPYHLIFLSLIVPLVVLALSRHSILHHFFLSVNMTVIIIAALGLDKLWNISKFFTCILLAWLLIINLSAIKNLAPWGITIDTEKKIVDFIYNDASSKPFRYEAFTHPYFWKDAWEYMFLWYAKPKYGYLPVEQEVNRVYIIWEDDNEGFFHNWYTKRVPQYGNIISSTQENYVHAERREKN